jgi:DNA-binding response OmpR family regulator
VFIARLRRKLGPGAIETVRGLGYRMAEREQ